MFVCKLKGLERKTTYKYMAPGIRSNGQNCFFSESGHAAIQINGIDEFNNMQANNFHICITPTQSLGWGQRGYFFIQSMATLYIKLKGMNSTTKMKANILSLHTLLTIGVRPKGENIFLKAAVLHNKERQKIDHVYTMVIYKNLSSYFYLPSLVIEILSYIHSVGKGNA